MSKHGPTNTSAKECLHGVALQKPCLDCDLMSEAFRTKRAAEKRVDELGIASTHKPRHRAPGVYSIGRKQPGEIGL